MGSLPQLRKAISKAWPPHPGHPGHPGHPPPEAPRYDPYAYRGNEACGAGGDSPFFFGPNMTHFDVLGTCGQKLRQLEIIETLDDFRNLAFGLMMVDVCRCRYHRHPVRVPAST